MPLVEPPTLSIAKEISMAKQLDIGYIRKLSVAILRGKIKGDEKFTMTAMSGTDSNKQEKISFLVKISNLLEMIWGAMVTGMHEMQIPFLKMLNIACGKLLYQQKLASIPLRASLR